MAMTMIRPHIPRLNWLVDGMRATLRFIRNAFFWLTDPFRRIPFRLWSACLLTALVCTVLVEAALFGLATYWYTDSLPGQLDTRTSSYAQDFAPYIARGSSSALQLNQKLDADCANFATYGDPLAFLWNTTVVAVVTDSTGRVLASAPGIPYVAGSPLAGQVPIEEQLALTTAMQDASTWNAPNTWHSPNVRQASQFDMAAAAPILDSHNHAVGAVFLRTQPQSAFYDMMQVIGPLAGVGLVVMVPIGALGGLFVAGAFGKRLSNRLTRLSKSVVSWSNGDLSTTIQERSRDEIGCLARNLNTMAADLNSHMLTRLKLAAAEERNRVARNLHDTVKQQAFAAAMQLGAARTVLEGSEGPALVFVTNAEKLTNKVQEDLMSIIHDLHPSIVFSPERPLSALLRECATDWSETSGVHVNLQAPDELDVSPETKQELMLIVHEALANVDRHSRATLVRITLAVTDGDGLVNLTVSDNGQGFDPIFTPRGMGVYSMRDRAASLPNGWFSIETAPGDGVTVRVACAAGLERHELAKS
jgi:signal transduction histidine kinase